MNHVRITFYVGLARKGDAPTLLDRDTVDARAGAVARFFGRQYASGTFTRADGYWLGTSEPSCTFTVVRPSAGLDVERAAAAEVAGYLARLHRQDAIGVEVAPVAFALATPENAPRVEGGRYARELDGEEAAGRG